MNWAGFLLAFFIFVINLENSIIMKVYFEINLLVFLLQTMLLSGQDKPVVNHELPSIGINKKQIIGSHNSYKQAINPVLWTYLKQLDSATAASLQYEHPSLTEQLQLGLRSLELDVFYDPEGGYYQNPKGLEIAHTTRKAALPYDLEQKLKLPGLKVFHIQDVDFRSSQLLFTDALVELKKWSDRVNEHYPIIVTINTKDREIPNTRKPLTFGTAALQSLDEEIRNVFNKDQLLTPDDVKGEFLSLEQAVLSVGWPKLKDVKGKFLFVLDEGEEKMNLYLKSFPDLTGAVLFINQKEGKENAAFMIVNDPIKNFEKISDLVNKGYMVRTRADANTVEARSNNYHRFKKAKLSGAQIITTDYYVKSRFFDSTYKVIFDDGTYERINTNKP